MKLQDVFDQLSYGELSQISIGGGKPGIIEEATWPRVLAHVQLGLTALYKRFILKEGRVKIALVNDLETYRMHSDYSIHSLRRPLEAHYLMDSLTARFSDDILKIERVLTDYRYDDREGRRHEVGLNNLADEYSVFTPNLTTLKVPLDIVGHGWDLPLALKTDNLEVVYRANHPKIVIPIGYFEPTRTDIELPESHLMALCYFIASRVHNPIGMTNEFHAGNSYAAKYEAECAELENEGLEINTGSQSTRLRRGGWA